jgi:Zn-dependent protease with chaperone function
MIQYIINTTAIWLISLIVFDLCLRKSTLHSYNRAFLIITAVLGALLPLYHAAPRAARLSPVFTKPLLVVSEVKQSIATITSMPHTAFPWTAWMAGIYLLGLTVSCCMLLREGLILFRWYRSADLRRYGDARVVVTHRVHGPFSAFGYIFISNAATYTPDELRFILQHESVHIHRRHCLDKTLMLLLRCIFWMNPLIYIYYSRLMMTHEYEADDTARAASRDYGHFLIHQHLAGAAPLIAHSFFHSPLKNRIRMLTAT